MHRKESLIRVARVCWAKGRIKISNRDLNRSTKQLKCLNHLNKINYLKTINQEIRVRYQEVNLNRMMIYALLIEFRILKVIQMLGSLKIKKWLCCRIGK